MRLPALTATLGLVLGSCLPRPAGAEANSEANSGRAYIIDGDTLAIGHRKFRLANIDAPESKQTCTRKGGGSWRCGDAATQALRSFVGGSTVRCEALGKSYDRIVARCYRPGAGAEIDLGRWMVQQGWAMASRYRTRAYVDDEQQARLESRGLWNSIFEPPAAWRRAQGPATR